MKDKCPKYESLFVFSKEKELMAHIESCEDCKKTHEDMLKLSLLVKETKQHFKAGKRNKRVAIAAVCASFFLIFAFYGAGLFGNYSDTRLLASIDASNSVISDMGLPVDEYGLVMFD